MHLPDSSELLNILAVRWETKLAREITADSTSVLTRMGSLSRMLDQGSSLPVVVETPYISRNCIHFTVSSSAAEFFVQVPHTCVLPHRQGKNFVADAARREKFHAGP